MGLAPVVLVAGDVDTKAKILTQMNNQYTDCKALADLLLSTINNRDLPPPLVDFINNPALRVLMQNILTIRTGISTNLT